ncbi:DUF4225 domain-containing protein [Erwinia sp. TECH1]
MDMALLAMRNGRNQAWAETMVNLQARQLINTANAVGGRHLQDGLSRIHFMEDIKSFIAQQFLMASQAKTDEECMICIKNLREERENLLEQSRLLQQETAKLYAKVKFVKENNKIVGYTISAVSIVISGVAVFGSIAMMATTTPIGVLAGAVLFVDSINDISKEIDQLRHGGHSGSEGIFADGAMGAAKFLGFKPENGLAMYQAATLGASAYSIFALTKKPGAWCLFRWMPNDYQRKIDTMSRSKLAMKIVGTGVKAKVLFDIVSVADPN